MKGKTAGPAPASARIVWAAMAAGFAAFAGGLALLVAGRLAAGVALALFGVLAVTLGYLAPGLPWDAWIAALRAPRRQGPAGSAAAPRRGRQAAAGAGATPAPAGPGRGLPELASLALDGLLQRLPESDAWHVNRMVLLAPAILLLTAAAILSISSTVQGVGAFVGALLVLWVYLQDMVRPLILPRLRQNLRALLALVPALPLQLYGAWALNSRYDSPRMVWTGFLVCAAASAYMLYAMSRWPLDFTEVDAPEPPLGWSPPRPFHTLPRLTLISVLLVLAALAGCLAEYVFPGDHAGLSVAMAFSAMALLIGSFPWIPGGLAWAPQLPPSLGALVALGSVALAFALGARGQDLVETGNINPGLWYFLAGGMVLVLGLSRFTADPGKDEAVQAGAWPRLEIAAVGLLVAVAFAMRVWKIGSFPFGVEGDEGGGGVWAMWALKGQVENPLIHQNYPLAFFSVTAAFFHFFGIGLETLRFHAVLFGTMSVATTYLFLRLNMGRAAAFLATLLMAFSYWHLHFSRFGHYNIEQVAMQMAAFYFVFKAFRTGKLWQWAVGGLAFGLAMFPHMAGRLLPFQGIALVVFFFLARRDLLRRYLPGFLAFMVLAWAIASPAVVYWNRARSQSLGRIQSVSIFDKNNTNAPIDTLSGFVRNCKVTMLMFNFEGDTRSRDNPVAPDKILEHWTGVLFGLALLYVLYHWREPVNFFLLAVFFINLAASAFSVEAPQTLRTSGNIPIVFAFIAVPLADLGAALRRAGRLPARAVYVLLLVAFAFFSWRSARRLFVDERHLAFDTEATYIAQVAGREGGPDTQAVFWGTGFASSHPPMELLRQGTPLRNFYGPFEYLPIVDNTGQDKLLFLADDYQQMLPYIQWLYPAAPARAIPDQPGYPDLAQYIRVNKDVIRASEGLDGKAVIDGKPVDVKGMDPAWPSEGLEHAHRISVAGSVLLDDYGSCSFAVTGEGDAEVSVDGRLLFRRRGGSVEHHEALLAKGLHDLALRLDPASSDDVLRLQLVTSRPGPLNGPWAAKSTGTRFLDRTHVLHFRSSGFYGQYFTSRMPEGTPVLENIEPIVLNHWLDSPLVGNWCVRWRTRFRVETPGAYRFTVHGGNYSEAKVDGKYVWLQGQPADLSRRPPVLTPSIMLGKGWHDYEAVFSTTGGPGCDLAWTTPDGKSGVFWTPNMLPVH